MCSIFEVSYKDIERLDAIALTRLMSNLIYSEAAAHNIPKSCVSGSLRITTRDDGQDGGVVWEGCVEKTDWFPSRNCLIQNKSSSFGPEACYKELFRNQKKKSLKPMLEDIGVDGKHYIIFNNKSLNEKMIKDRKERMLTGFREAGKDSVTENNISFYGSMQIAKWTNQYYPAVIYVKERLGQSIGVYFKTWETWSGYDETKLQYVTDEERTTYMDFIRDELVKPQKVIRLIGLSGLGKSRLVFETFRPPNDVGLDLNQEALNKMVAYIDCQGSDSYTIRTHVSQLIALNRHGILVFDNCSLETHEGLVREITQTNSKLSMISIDNDPSERSQTVIRLNKLPDQIIKQIVESAFPNLAQNQIIIQKIIELSDGFPKIASLLADSYLKDEPNVGSLTEESLVKRMIGFPLDFTQDDCKILCALSVFDHIGFQRELECQLKYVAENIAKSDFNTAHAYVKKFIDRTIIDQRDRYIQVVPKPLAIRLAEEWWKMSPQSLAQELFTDENLSSDMIHSLCKQFRLLDYVPEVEDIAKKLCGKQAPFGQAEVLFTERGAMVFRYLVEVNPQATADAIYRVISETDLAELKQIKGRRYLILALEMLCFWKDQFRKASRSLMWLALSENELYANNATGQFLQLFQISLSGSSVSYEDRLFILDELMNRRDDDSVKLAIKALKKVISYENTTKICGAELQGTKRELKEWEPEKWCEIFDYIRGGLERLLCIFDHSPAMEKLVKEAFEEALFGLLQLGLFEEIKSFVAKMTNKTNSTWNNLHQKLLRSQKRDIVGRVPESSKYIADCIEILSPSTIEDKIKTIICKPPYDNEKEGSGKYIDISEQKALEYLSELTKNKQIYGHLHLLLDGEQRYGMKVGYQLGRMTDDNEYLFNALTEALKRNDLEHPNVATIAGFFRLIKECDTTLYGQLMQRLFCDEFMKHFLFDIVMMQAVDAEDLRMIAKLLEANLLIPNQFRLLSYGSVLKSCTPEHVQQLLKKAININNKFIHPAIDIIVLYLMFDENNIKFDKLCLFSQTLIMGAPLSGYKHEDSMCLYHRHKLLKTILKQQKIKDNLIPFIINDIFNALKNNRDAFKIYSEVRSLVFLLIEHKFEKSWEMISDTLTKETENAYMLLYILNPKNEYGVKKGLDSVVPESVLIEWCKKEKRACEILPSLIPVLLHNDSDVKFNDLIYKLLELKLFNQHTLDAIYSNMMPRAWSGSAIPIYATRKKLFQSLVRYKDTLIREWAETSIENLNKKIEAEKEREMDDYFKYR